jgi:hypothetical protein
MVDGRGMMEDGKWGRKVGVLEYWNIDRMNASEE